MSLPCIHYRPWIFGTIAMCTAFFVTRSVYAEKLVVPLTVQDFAQVEEYVEKNTGRIYENLAEAQCGGWDVSQRVGDTVGQGIALVTGVPGRKTLDNNPLNAQKLGMAYKDDEFYFPAEPSTCGFSTACLPPDGSSDRRRPPFLRAENYGQQCERPLDGYRTDDFPDPDGKVTYSCGGGKMSDVDSDTDFCPTVFDNNPSLNNPGAGFIRTPGNTDSLDADTAGGICQRLNEDWIYSLWRKPVFVPGEDADGNPISIFVGFDYTRKGCTQFDDGSIDDSPGDGYELDSYRYCCTDQPLGSAFKNCFACTGAECYDPLTVNGISRDSFRIIDTTVGKPYPTSHNQNPDRERRIYSFFRHYLASYTRNKTETGDNTNPPDEDPTVEPTFVDEDKFDKHELQNMPVACYGYWFWRTDPGVNDEILWDPELVRIPRELFRCVIASFYEESSPLGNKQFYWNDKNKETQMRMTQAGKGSYFGFDPKTSDPYEDPPVEDAPRIDPEDDDDTSAWFKSLGRAFSLISFKLIQKPDFSFSEALKQPDKALQRSTVQRFVPDKEDLKNSLGAADKNSPEVLNAFKNEVLSRGAIIGAFDDMVTQSNQRRPFVDWWQKVETTMNAYLTPPTVTLVLPAGWSIDLDPLHPLFTPYIPDTSAPDWRSNPEVQSIEVQLELHPDLLDEVTDYLEDSLIVQYSPKPVTVLVPSGSAKEYRALAQKWCSYIQQRDKALDCNSASGSERQLMERLLEYADRIEDSRKLRAQATEIRVKFLEAHTKIQKILGEWVIKNMTDYTSWRTEWETREGIRPIWQVVQMELQKFTNEVNQPWCMNNRFTLPVYSLLDQWFPYLETGGQPEKNLDDPDFPVFEELFDYRPQPGITFDASHIRLGTGVFMIPVIEPLPVALDSLDIGQLVADVPTLEPLPEIPDFTTDVEAFIPEVLKGKNSPLTLSQEFTLETLENPESILREIYEMFRDMNDAYSRFWDSITVDPEDVDDGTEEDCYEPGTEYCQHFEFDLHERFMRIGSRPNVLFAEDFDAGGTFMDPVNDGPYACLDEDFDYNQYWVCQVLPPHAVVATQGYTVRNSVDKEQKKRLDDLRIRAFRETLEDVSKEDNPLPYIVPYSDILPSFSVREPIILYQTGAIVSSSSSSGS